MSSLPEVQVGSEKPLFNIGVVARMTGLSMATLRAWERRYEFPELDRTSGGHRLYSENDVIRLRWVKGRIDEGMQTSHAIQALRHQEESGHLIVEAPTSETWDKHRSELNFLLDVEAQHLLEALLRGDLQMADRVLAEALAVTSPEDIILDCIAPVFRQIGEAWEEKRISVADEHLATNYLRQRLLMWMLSGPPPRPVNPIVLACAPNEWHEGSLLVLGAVLRRRGWPVAYLGQAVPLPDLAGFVKKLHPSLVVLVAMRDATAAELVQWPQYMPGTAKSGQPVVGYGGRVFSLQPEWRTRMTGTYLGESFHEGLQTIERLL